MEKLLLLVGDLFEQNSVLLRRDAASTGPQMRTPYVAQNFGMRLSIMQCHCKINVFSYIAAKNLNTRDVN